MHPKWYFSVALLFIALLGGILSQQKVQLPNQEIILQFANEDVSFDETQKAVAVLEKKLQHIGVANLQISDEEDGKLVISYYSDTDVDGIKKLLSGQRDLDLGIVSPDETQIPLSLPSKEHPQGYDFDVYEIIDGHYAFSDRGGNCAVEFKSGADRFLSPNAHVPVEGIFIFIPSQILKTTLSFPNYTIVGEDIHSHKFPEVRAGPLV